MFSKMLVATDFSDASDVDVAQLNCPGAAAAPIRGAGASHGRVHKEIRMDRGSCRRVAQVVLALAAFGLTGCTYLGHRGRDAADMFEVGLTFSKKPQFALLPVDYFNLVGLGYSNVEGTYAGIGNRRVGAMPIKDDGSYGLLFWGKDALKVGDLNPKDPHEVWVGEMERLTAEGKPLPTERPDYHKGLVRLPIQDNAPPPVTFMQCRRNIHLGWVGLHASFRPLDIIDFLLGWTTLDILNDDSGPAPGRQTVATSTAATGP